MEKAREVRLSASLQPLSGQLKDFPADAVIENILVECKVRSFHLDAQGERCITIRLAWLEKVLEEAKRVGRVGKDYGIVIIHPKGTRQTYVLCKFDNFITLLEKKA